MRARLRLSKVADPDVSEPDCAAVILKHDAPCPGLGKVLFVRELLGRAPAEVVAADLKLGHFAAVQPMSRLRVPDDDPQ